MTPPPAERPGRWIDKAGAVLLALAAVATAWSSYQPTELEATADATAETARLYVQRATNYVLGVVLFAVALFFAGISSKLPRPGLRMAILVVGAMVFITAAAWVATFPVSFSI